MKVIIELNQSVSLDNDCEKGSVNVVFYRGSEEDEHIQTVDINVLKQALRKMVAK